MFRILTFAFIGAICSSFCNAQEKHAPEPEKLTTLRDAWTQAKERGSRPIKEKYLTALDKLRKTLTKQGNLGAAVLVRDEIEVLTQGAERKEQGEGAGVPAQLTNLRNTYERELERVSQANDKKYVVALKNMKAGFTKQEDLESALAVEKELKVLEQKETKGGYLADLSRIQFLDYRNKTWHNDIRGEFEVQRVPSGYQVDCRGAGGFYHKLMVFSAEEMKGRMLASFTIKKGNCIPSIRPRDLRPKGTPYDFEFKPDTRYDIVVSTDGRSATFQINGKRIVVPYEFGESAYYAFKIHRASSVVFHDLRFE